MLKPGVTIMLAGVSEQDYKAFGEACIAAGANVGEFPSETQRKSMAAFGWSKHTNAMYHYMVKPFDDRLQIVTADEALGRAKDNSKTIAEAVSSFTKAIVDGHNSDSGWHERGELPPVGSHLEVTFGNKSIWHECVVLPGKKIAIDRYAGWHVMEWQDDFEFRPIKTEREKFVERLDKEWQSQEKTLADFFADQYDKGLRYTE